MSSAYSKGKEIQALKKEAMKYYTENRVPVEMENVLNLMFHDKPPDVYGYLANYFGQFANQPKIHKITASQVLDSNGQHTIQLDVWCTVENTPKFICSSTIPRADILGQEDFEKVEIQIEASVEAAIHLINNELGRKLKNLDPLSQAEIDSDILSFIDFEMEKHDTEINDELDTTAPSDEKLPKKSIIPRAKGGKESAPLSAVPDRPREVLFVGCEVAAAISQAVCICAAKSKNIPIYQHVAQLADQKRQDFRIPLPMITIIQNGKSVHGKVICIKEFMIVPGTKVSLDMGLEHIERIFNQVTKYLVAKQTSVAKLVTHTGALCPQLDSVNQGIDMLLEAIHALGLTVGEDVHLAINAGGYESFDHDRGRYEVMAGHFKSPDDMVEFWCDIIKKYPNIIALIDPIRAEDIEQWLNLCERVSENVFVMGDTFYERPGLSQETKVPTQTSGIVLHIERMNTITDIIACAKKFQDLKNELVISTNNGDTNDTFIVDLAVGLNARFLKVGGPRRGEKISKLNRLSQIMKEMLAPKEFCNTDLTDKEAVPTQLSVNTFIDNASSFKEIPRSSIPNSNDDQENQLEDQTNEEKTKCHLQLHEPFIFHVIKKPQTETEDHV